jgi:hypothetical protein
MYNTLKKRNINCLYHFTDISNIDSIISRGGLYSFKYLADNGIDNVKYGGNDLSHKEDAKLGMDNYVHLCFLKNHPMEHIVRTERSLNTFWLKINLKVLKIPGVKFTAGVSNKSGVALLDTKKALVRLDIDAICNFIPFSIEGNQARKSSAEKYEILIPNLVPLNYIENI